MLFTDLTDFTPLTERLDPESLHQVMARYFTAMRSAIERHRGQVEKYIGDAIMAVFGVPQLHEDDAVRAARCAMEMRNSLGVLNRELRAGWSVTLHARYGICTGEVAFARVGQNPFFALGDPVNVAQRLESAAQPDEVLVGRETAHLLRDVAELEPMEAMKLKGKANPVSAWRLLAVAPTDEVPRGPAAPGMVGRRRELSVLRAALEDVISERRSRAITILGPAGVGKSRVVRSFAAEAEASATVAVGRCLPYGEGITFWPLEQVVEQLAGRTREAAIATLLGDEREAHWLAARIARAIGWSSGTAEIDEIQLGVRRLVEAAARDRPLVLVIEDIHWAEPTLLDVLEHVATHVTGVAFLLVSIARPELMARRPISPVSDVLRVRALSEPESGELLEHLDPMGILEPDDRVRLLAAAEGNPFFLEQLVAMKHESGGDAAVPATIQAVLAARIDGLPEPERAVADCAAVEGRQFHRGALAELLASEQRPELDDVLVSLTQRDLIRPARPDLPGERGYRFSHILVRDAVYGLLPKTRRADLHERYARWLEARSTGERDFGEIIGFHLEQAYRCSVDLHPVRSAEHRRLARAGAHHLGGVGRSALGRGDITGAVNLLERATTLLDEDEPMLGSLLPELGSALIQAGRLPAAERVLMAAVRRAQDRGDSADAAHALVGLLAARLRVDTGAATEEIRERFGDLRAAFSASDDDLGLDRLWRLLALVHWLEARSADAEDAWQVAVEHARLAGDDEGQADALCWIASSAFCGPMPVDDGIARCEAIRRELHANARAEAFVLQPLAGLWAMRGEFATARELLGRAAAILTDLGLTILTATGYYEAFVALLADDPIEAEACARNGYRWLEDSGENALRADIVVMLARSLHAQGRLDEAFDLTLEAERQADEHDLSPQFGWRAVRAVILARRGAVSEARRLSDEALTIVTKTDWVRDHADALVTRAEVLMACGEQSAAAAAMQSALELYEQKGSIIDVERVRTNSHLRSSA